MNARHAAVVTATLCTFFVSLFVARGAYAEFDGSDRHRNYRVSIFENAPGSKALLAGDLRTAVMVADNATRLKQPLGALVNLCAAHLSAGDLDSAVEYCGKAVKESESGMVRTAGVSDSEVKASRAIALANYGVLQAMLGDKAGAVVILEKAGKYDPRNGNIAINLSLLKAGNLVAVERNYQEAIKRNYERRP